jgi:hypothetical protein
MSCSHTASTLSCPAQVSEILYDDEAREAMMGMRSEIVAALATVYGRPQDQAADQVPCLPNLHPIGSGDEDSAEGAATSS